MRFIEKMICAKKYCIVLNLFCKSAALMLMTCILCFFNCAIYAQNYAKEPLKLEVLGLEAGLSQSTVNAIVQDDLGFIWIGTQDGLNRYDGYNFKVFRHSRKDSLSIIDNHIFSLFIDSENLLWAGTDKSGLSCFNPKTQRFSNYTPQKDHKNSISNGVIRAITEDKNGNIWIGTSYGLNIFDKKSKSFSHLFAEKNNKQALPSNTITALATDEKKELIWVGTTSGIVTYHAKTQKITTISFEKDTLPKSILKIYVDNLQFVWVATDDNGLWQYDKAKKCFVRFTDFQLNAPFETIFEDERGHLWLIVKNGEIIRYHFASKSYTIYNPDKQNNIAGGQLMCGFIDRFGVIWFGTETEGILKYDDQKERFRTFAPKPNAVSAKENVIWTVFKDRKDDIWVGTEHGIFSLPKGEKDFVQKLPNREDLQRNSSFTIFYQFEHEEDIAVGLSNRGLWRMPKNGKDLEKAYDTLSFTQTTNSIIKDSKGFYWAAASNCIARMKYDEEKKKFSYKYFFRKGKRFARQPAISLHEDYEGNFWFATSDSGLVKATRTPDDLLENFEYFPSIEDDMNTLSNNFIFHTAISADKQTIWVAAANGLNKFDIKTKKVVRLGEKYEQANFPIYAILIDEKGNLWMSSNVGILKYDPIKETFQNYTMRDGLQSNEFNQYSFYQAPDGEMFFGGIKGFNSFYPNDFKPNPILPKVVITDFKIFNQAIKIGENSPLKTDISSTDFIELTHDQFIFSFEFVGLSFRLSEKNQYAYIMENFEKDWNYVGNRRHANYSNLPPGEYVFKVKAANNDGIWNEQGRSIHIRILPPFWKTWWFISLAFVVILGAIYGIYKKRVAIIQHQKDELERQVIERTLLIQEQKEELFKTLDLVNAQKEKIEELNEDFISSLNAAVRIQEATLPFLVRMNRQIGEGLFFVLYKPRDIVSGDFYWTDIVLDVKILIVADCTGHGVPGAFMSMIGTNLLEEIVKTKKIVEPAEILENINKGVRYALGQDQNSTTSEGMDMIVVSRKKENNYASYAGAMIPLYYVTENNLYEIKATKKSVGGVENRYDLPYEEHLIPLETETIFYLCTDGFKDQFGGEQNKKFMAKNLKKVLLDNHKKSMEEQKELLNWAYEDWVGQSKELQTDDITIVGWKM